MQCGSVSELVNPVSAAATVATTGRATAVPPSRMGHVEGICSYRKVLRRDVIMFSIFLDTYAIVLLSAIIIIVFQIDE